LDEEVGLTKPNGGGGGAGLRSGWDTSTCKSEWRFSGIGGRSLAEKWRLDSSSEAQNVRKRTSAESEGRVRAEFTAGPSSDGGGGVDARRSALSTGQQGSAFLSGQQLPARDSGTGWSANRPRIRVAQTAGWGPPQTFQMRPHGQGYLTPAGKRAPATRPCCEAGTNKPGLRYWWKNMGAFEEADSWPGLWFQGPAGGAGSAPGGRRAATEKPGSVGAASHQLGKLGSSSG